MAHFEAKVDLELLAFRPHLLVNTSSHSEHPLVLCMDEITLQVLSVTVSGSHSKHLLSDGSAPKPLGRTRLHSRHPHDASPNPPFWGAGVGYK